jgi:hypothetical protein
VILRQAEDSVEEQQTDVDVGIGGQELREDRDDMEAAELGRGRDDQLAGGGREFA